MEGGSRRRRGRSSAAPAEAADSRPDAGDDQAHDAEGEPEGPTEAELAEVEIDAGEALPLVAIETEAHEDGDAEAGEHDAVPARAGTTALVARPSPRASGGESLVRHDPLTAYMQEIRRIPLLTREEEHELAVRFRETGDVELARRLVTANLRLVVKIAHEYRRAHRNLLDLVQEGNIGLMQAVRKYDPFRGVKLSSYAAWWIRAYILKFILNNWRLVKIGTTQAQRKLFFNLRKEKERLEQLGFAPEHKLLAERLDVTEEEVAEMERRLESSEMSLDAPVSRDDDSGRTRMDSVPSSSATRPDVHVEGAEFRALLRAKLEAFAATLAGRDHALFTERWLTDEPLTLQELGDRFGITRERARQLEKRLLDRLREYLEAELGSAVDIGELKADD